MTSRKLSESDKQTILQLYRQTPETSSTIASRYGVSTSTISRILKSNISEKEYEALIQQKRSGRLSEAEPVEAGVEASSPQPVIEQLEVVTIPPAAEPAPGSNGRRSRRRSSAPVEPPVLPQPESVKPEPPKLAKSKVVAEKSTVTESQSTAAMPDEILTAPEGLAGPVDDEFAVEAIVLQEMLGEELLDQDEEDDLEEDDLDDDLDEDFDDDLDSRLEEGPLLVGAGKALVQVLPLAEATLPKTCYLVVDRSAELIARPLKEFGDLGQIPEAEIQEKTLPVFDNHRVAKRYSNPRTQRVIKLPDGRVLQKTSTHLQAKGITRLLIDGQIYSLN